MINIGDEVKDKVTGLKGIAIGRTEWLNGCATIGVRPPLTKDGKMEEALWFDETQLDVVKRGKVKIGQQVTGGPKPIPRQNRG